MEALTTLRTKAVGKYQRSASRFFARRPIRMLNSRPLISFSFDDFPRSALITGGAILKRHDVTGTYYASFGLMDTLTPTGHIFGESDVEFLFSERHELGCHTFAHCHAYDTAPDIFEASIVENARALQAISPGAEFKTLSYPISGPNPATKRLAGRHFEACRGGGQIHNQNILDLNFASAFFLEQSREDPAAVYRAIDSACRDRGWLIFATHDVCDLPTRYGCGPSFFEDVVRYAVNSPATVVPVSKALELINGGTN